MFLAREPDRQYTLIMGDAFNDYSVPYHLTTREFNERVRAWLAEDGIYMVNLIDGPRRDFLRAYVNTLMQTFVHVEVVPAIQGWRESPRVTFVILASQSPLNVERFDTIDAGDGQTLLADLVLPPGPSTPSWPKAAGPPDRPVRAGRPDARARGSRRIARPTRRAAGQLSRPRRCAARMKVFHCDHFTYPLPPDHRFPASKYRLLRERVGRELAAGCELVVPEAATDSELLLAHDREYLDKVVDGELSQRRCAGSACRGRPSWSSAAVGPWAAPSAPAGRP